MEAEKQKDNPDRLIVKGVPPLDGEYPCDVVGMLLENHPQTLTNREGHRIKVMSGVRAGEFWEAMERGDNDFMIALAAVVLTRANKRFDEALLWDAPMGAGIAFDIAEREVEEDDASPPEEKPTAPTTTPIGESGGTSTSSPPSDGQENGQSPTGPPSSSLSGQEISAI